MLTVYLNYPHGRVSVHGDAGCTTVISRHKAGQRRIRIRDYTLELELRRFRDGTHGFASKAHWNDMWITLDLGDEGAEWEALAAILEALGARYRPFRGARAETHCTARGEVTPEAA